MTTTNSVMQLHQRLKNSEEESPSADGRNQEMLKELESAVMMTQSMLTNITSNRYDEHRKECHLWKIGIFALSRNILTFSVSVSFFSSNATTKTMQENGEYTQMMDKCTNILQKVQNHVQHNTTNNNNL